MRLTLLNNRFEKRNNRWHGKYQCSCGNTVILDNASVLCGNTKSCGCFRRQESQSRNKTHGHSHKERIYSIWKGIRNRCNNCNSPSYKNYGAKGITLCDEWNEYPVFREWSLKNGYSDELTIERNNNALGYSPDNCRWVTKSAQGKNTSRVIPIEIRKAIKDNSALTYAELQKKYGICKASISRIRKTTLITL